MEMILGCHQIEMFHLMIIAEYLLDMHAAIGKTGTHFKGNFGKPPSS